MNSYGYIETFGYVTSIVAADAALKAANVTLKNCYFVEGGIVTIEVMGDVAAVTAAIEAGTHSAKKLGNFLSSNVIARVDNETKKILINKSTVVQKVSEAEDTSKENTVKTEMPISEDYNNEKQEEDIEKKFLVENKTEEKEHVRKSRKKYQDMKVIELKMKVNNLKLDYTWNQIKGMTKKKLIEILIKNNQEE
ncbi:MAG: BMC domain-containing protein [Leptotrichiaceae bacterium]|nr:BMC domain-containing protein [Leptotrichiaceae bacterium]MBP6281068.1 BMC domain-containing protein [Leptotrichiaceae bacterium]MBP7101540.1 BMC domain-containing protein [Leptotrichiaceae bacterium]MBP9629386.1 BMC domain-containing protein [Leptotrichiaceae bacterium]